jgi:cobalt-zinc-cadmium efflux system membrane fusion protein
MRVILGFIVTITILSCLVFVSFGCKTPPDVENEHALNADHDHDHSADADLDDHAAEDEEDHVHENPSTVGHAETGGLNDQAFSVIDLETVPVTQIDFHEVIEATGKIINNQNNEVHLNALVPGRVNEALADWGETVKKGQILACIESIELGRKRAEYEKAIAELELAESDFNRVDRLFKKDAVSERRLLEAQASLKAARINLQYAEKMLLLTGLEKDEILEPPDEHPTIPGCSFHLTSPIDGVVIERNVVKGEKIDPGTCIYKILDLSTVWVETDVYEKDLPRVKTATGVQLTVPAFPDRVFKADIDYVAATLDETTRTVKLRSVAHNSDYSLKPGMFAEVRIVVGSGRQATAIPQEAILQDKGDQFVYVKHGDHFDRRVVVAGDHNDEGLVAVLSGLKLGELVVVQGHHQLNSQQEMANTDPHAGHTH